jgi:putative membrane protein
MNIFIKLIISSLSVFLTAELLPGVEVTDYLVAIWVAVALSLLNGFLKPILVVLTIPVTLFSLGLFLLVINAAIILMADYFVEGFKVDGWIMALIFSFVLSVITSIMESLGGKKKKEA